MVSENSKNSLVWESEDNQLENQSVISNLTDVIIAQCDSLLDDLKSEVTEVDEANDVSEHVPNQYQRKKLKLIGKSNMKLRKRKSNMKYQK
jgi:hypothetical protein